MPHLKSLFDKHGYDTVQDWTNSTHLQYGRSGLVINSKNPEQSYRTAFFEAFGDNYFARGEGATVEEAEANAYQKMLKKTICPHEHYVPFGWDMSSGKCVACHSVKRDMFLSNKVCATCGKEHVKMVIDSKPYCMKHYADYTGDNEIYQSLVLVAKKGLEYNVFSEGSELENQKIFDEISNKKYKIANDLNICVMEWMKQNKTEEAINRIFIYMDENPNWHEDMILDAILTNTENQQENVASCQQEILNRMIGEIKDI